MIADKSKGEHMLEPIEAEPMAVGRPIEREQQRTASAQARVEAVADLIKTAMPKAGTLQLTTDESKALLADFPDSDFQPGAGGKEQLLYIEHSALRDRFNSVLGLGQWVMICRETWNEDFETAKEKKKGVRVYARCMLLIRGCYVGESVGDMDYFPHNAAQNYGDAFEGAQTAALRRCAKNFGVGLQAWRKGFSEGWRERRYQTREQAQTRPPEPAKPNGNGGTHQERIAMFVKWLYEHCGTEIAQWAIPYLRTHTPDGGETTSVLMPNEDLTGLTEAALGAIRKDMAGFLKRLGEYAEANKPKAKPIEVPRDADAVKKADDLWWKETEIHFGQNKGTKLGDIDTKTLFGWWANWSPTAHPDTGEIDEEDSELRGAFDAAGAHYNFKTK